ncbi:hypothetical protein ES703_107107 [subsurface metagenome]
MNEFKLQPCDILVNVNRKKDILSVIKRWAVGPYSHVSLYLGQMGFFFNRRQGRIMRFPMIFESNGRGCYLRLLSERYGEKVVVMRLNFAYNRRRIPYVITEALQLASDESARYDYWCITRYIIPRIICEKLHLPMPLSWHRDPKQVCSEAVYEACYRGGLAKILSQGVVPLPGDFVVDNYLLECVGCVILSPELV